MKWKPKIIVGLLSLLMMGFSSATPPPARRDANVILFRVQVDDERPGPMLCALYRDPDNWLSKTPYHRAKTEIESTHATCRFGNVPKGHYGIAAFHDENGNGDLDTNLIGIPKEGYAMSRNAHYKTILKPKWKDAVFPHEPGVNRQSAKMKY